MKKDTQKGGKCQTIEGKNTLLTQIKKTMTSTNKRISFRPSPHWHSFAPQKNNNTKAQNLRTLQKKCPLINSDLRIISQKKRKSFSIPNKNNGEKGKQRNFVYKVII